MLKRLVVKVTWLADPKEAFLCIQGSSSPQAHVIKCLGASLIQHGIQCISLDDFEDASVILHFD